MKTENPDCPWCGSTCRMIKVDEEDGLAPFKAMLFCSNCKTLVMAPHEGLEKIVMITNDPLDVTKWEMYSLSQLRLAL